MRVRISIAVLIFACLASIRPGESLAQVDKMSSHFSDFGIEKISGGKAPDFELVTLAGDSVSLTHFSDDLLILHFWATWCKPCRTEMPVLDQLVRQLSDQSVSILAVSIDDEQDSLKIVSAKDQMEIDFPVAASYTGHISSSYWTWGIPVSYLILPDGKILGRMRGSRNWLDPKFRDFLLELAKFSKADAYQN